MANNKYSAQLVHELSSRTVDSALHYQYAPLRYEEGRKLEWNLTGVSPAVEGKATMIVEKFLGGGFAGQVYRARVEGLELPDGASIPGLEIGKQYAIKIVIPPSRFSVWFRNTVFWLAYQGSFSSQVNYDACRAGLLFQKFLRRAAAKVFGHETAVKDAYASFYDETLHAFGEITEWVEGRTWHLEADPAPSKRLKWKTIPLEETESVEFISTRRFMAKMVELLHEMGAPEFARQYEWWTMKSQPNVMQRTDIPAKTPEQRMCAIDFRAGLALLPFLPMAPGDIKLILAGLFKRGSLVQFDRCNLGKFNEYIRHHQDEFTGLETAIEEFNQRDPAYRRSLPDLSHHGFKLLFDGSLRRDVRHGLVQGYQCNRLVSGEFANKLRQGGLRFLLFYFIGLLPFLGSWIRRLWGNRDYRAHVLGIFTKSDYRRLALRARVAHNLVNWLRAGRCSDKHATFLKEHPYLFLLEAWTLGFCPIARLHRVMVEPSRILIRLRESWSFARDFWKDHNVREKWFLDQLDEGEREGMLHPEDKAAIAARVRDPFIVKYLKCLAVHFATLPVTQIVSVVVAALVAAPILIREKDFKSAAATFTGILVLFQIMPISPGSICRGGFVVYLMIKERDWRDYLIACPLSFVKYIGYLAFPLQMTTTYPELARFLAGNWAAKMVHVVPVFGEQGALLEHWIFDLFFNIPQQFANWAAPHLRILLDIWMLAGIAAAMFVFEWFNLQLFGSQVNTQSPEFRHGIQLAIGTICLFVLPRVLFFPLLSRKKK